MGGKAANWALLIGLIATGTAGIAAAAGVQGAVPFAMSAGSLISLLLALFVLRGTRRLFAGISLLLAFVISLPLVDVFDSRLFSSQVLGGDQFWPLIDIVIFTFIGIVFANALLITRGKDRHDDDDDEDF